jgi:hypothetical protein
MLTDQHLFRLRKNERDADLKPWIFQLCPPESANARALAATGGVNAWNCLLLDDADLVFCRGLGDANKSGSRRTPNQRLLQVGTE